MVDATAKTIADKGLVILTLWNHACHGLNRTLHSASEQVSKLTTQLDLLAKILTTLKSTFMQLMLPDRYIKRVRKHPTSTRHMHMRAKACLTMKLMLEEED